jgi:hypothetical protein
MAVDVQRHSRRRRRRRRRHRCLRKQPSKVAHVTAATKKGSFGACLFSLSIYATLVIVRLEWSVKNKASLTHIYTYCNWKSNPRYRRVLHIFTYYEAWCIYNMCATIVQPRGMKLYKPYPDVFMCYIIATGPYYIDFTSQHVVLKLLVRLCVKIIVKKMNKTYLFFREQIFNYII